MRRSLLILALAAAVAIVAAVIVAALNRGPDVKLDPKPNGVSTFGFSDGFGADLSEERQNALLDRIHAVTGDGGIVSAPLRWDGTKLALPNWYRYDLFLDRVRAHHLVWLPEINISNGTGAYLLPDQAVGGMPGWTEAVRAIGQRYGPGGDYAQSSAERAGFDGIVRYQLWNEPNSKTGNATSDRDGSVDLDPAVATEIMRAGGSGLRSAAAAGGWRGRLDILGWGIGTIDLNYLQQLKAADPKILREVDTIAFHVYASVDPLHCPTIDSAGSTVERTQASHCIRSLMDVREWLDDNGGAQVGLAITEGGFSGSDDDCVPPNVVDEKKQALFNHRTVDWLRTHPELKFGVYLPYHVLDSGSVPFPGSSGSSCDDSSYDQAYWQDNLGMVRPDMSLKPVGASFRAQIRVARRQAAALAAKR